MTGFCLGGQQFLFDAIAEELRLFREQQDVLRGPFYFQNARGTPIGTQRGGQKYAPAFGSDVAGAGMNQGGFSWWRFFGVSAFKSRVSRRIGIPLTHTGRRQKLGSLILRMLGVDRWV